MKYSRWVTKFGKRDVDITSIVKDSPNITKVIFINLIDGKFTFIRFHTCSFILFYFVLYLWKSTSFALGDVALFTTISICLLTSSWNWE